MSEPYMRYTVEWTQRQVVVSVPRPGWHTFVRWESVLPSADSLDDALKIKTELELRNRGMNVRYRIVKETTEVLEEGDWV